MVKILLAGLAMLTSHALIRADSAAANDGLSSGFVRPPASARPWVYWFWLDGNITREGITADLEAMARAGIGGVLVMEVAQGSPTGPVAFASPEWRGLFRFMLAEAHRLGVQVNMNNDAGWCGSGGPWITPELAMQKLTASETFTQGPKHVALQLPQPPTTRGFYRDVAVLAFPTPGGEDVRMADSSPSAGASVSGQDVRLEALLDGNPRTVLTLPKPQPDHPQWVEVEFPRPFTARTATLQMIGNFRFGVHGAIEVSADGRTYAAVRQFDAQPPLAVLGIPETTARGFRIVFTRVLHPRLEKLKIAELDLSPCLRIEDLAPKAAFIPAQFSAEHNLPVVARWPAAPASLAIPRGQIVDLSSKMDKDGALAWQAPEGKWTILRIGYTLTGRQNHPAPEAGLGLECDKCSKEAAQAAFDGLLGRLIDDSPDLVGAAKTLVSMHIDSWEVGSQNWTPRMREQFQRRRGYDPSSFLPAITGRVVESPEISERFLWDLRQTVSDLVRENYAGELRRLAHQHGMRLSIEGYFGCPCEEMAYGGQADEPMGEFWWTEGKGGHYSCTEMASAAHVYGKRIVAAEAFTAGDKERWLCHPGNIKDLGDWAFCEGVNRFVFHRYAMQPWLDRRPGMAMGPWGQHYERTQTWWEQSRAWHEYLARCQFLLQQGLFVADICCLEPEGSPRRFSPPESVRPANSWDRPGYNFDGCTPEALITRMTVRNGRLVLPDGMSYRVLLLPEVETMTPQLLGKIRQLVEAGATVIGPKAPIKSPSLADYPGCDEIVKRLADELWSSGRIISGRSPAEVLADMGVPPDFSTPGDSGPQRLRFTHRTIGATDVYFVANKTQQFQQALCSFRVQDRRPELWRPDTGQIERVAVYDEAGGCVRIPIWFEPNGPVFVVFRSGEAAAPDRITSVARNGRVILDTAAKAATVRTAEAKKQTPAIILTRNGRGGVEAEVWEAGVYTLKTADGKTRKIEVASLPRPQEITGPWEVSFDPKWGGPEKPVRFAALENWAQRAEAAIRFYSGTATYRTAFSANPTPEIQHPIGKRLLDLGKVAVMAQVKLNGQDLGVLWKPPYHVDVTGAVKPGENSLELRVTNLWVNRQIGDEQLPEDSDRNPNGTLKDWPQWLLEGKPSPTGRYTFTTWRLWKKDDPLSESGLLGPVVLRTAVLAE